MCTVSYVGEAYREDWTKRYPWINPQPLPQSAPIQQLTIGVSQQEFDKLKREVEELKRLLKLAKEVDKALGTPDCEMDEKVAFIKRAAEIVGVDLEDVFA